MKTLVFAKPPCSSAAGKQTTCIPACFRLSSERSYPCREKTEIPGEDMDASLQRELERLRQAPIAEIRHKYRELFAEEPRSRHKQSLFRHVAWRMQARAEGGLSGASAPTRL